MAIKRSIASIDVVEAARRRIKNVFRNGVPVYLSFSGGKDSIVLAHLVLTLIQEGEIDPAQLHVHFVDEEAIFPCIEKAVMDWRRKFLAVGATFDWFCIEVKHFNCFNELSEEETFICWDSEKADVWVRHPPSFAIRTHPWLNPRKDAYQDFLPRYCADGITIVGLRTAESIQRLRNIAIMTDAGAKITKRRHIFPVYDWRDNDVWLYLLNNGVDVPDIYLYLWQSGTSKRQLRVSQFFSVDTARSLVQMNEYYPDLMERITRREPNAYLAALYWDSEMFGRRTRKRKQLEGEDTRDYKAMLIRMFSNIPEYFPTENQRKTADRYRKFFLQVSAIINDNECQKVYEALIRGDPKLRSYRALYQIIYSRYIDESKQKGAVSI